MTIRKIYPEDFDGLVQLYEEVWPDVDYDKVKKANFIVKESQGINYCAEDGGKIVGSRTSCPMNFFLGEKELNTAQIGDSCVHPSYRGKGLFLKMNQVYLQDFFSERNKGELIFNISVLASRKAYEKLGWKYIESLMALRKFVRPFHLFCSIGFDLKKLSVPVKWDKRNDVIDIEKELLEKREEFLCCGSVNLLHVRYDEPTFKWRMKSGSGIKQYSVKEQGSVIYKMGYRGGIKEIEIGEIFLHEYTKKNLKTLLKQFSKKLQPDILMVLVSEGHPFRPWYKSCLFLNNPRQKYLHHGVRVETEKMKNICYEPKNWAISSLDIDTF